MPTATVTAMMRDRSLENRYAVVFDNGVHVGLIGYRDADSMYARSYNTGQWYLVERTGEKIRREMVRVRITPAKDAGLADDTVIFDPAERWGGRVNYAVFTRPERMALLP